MKISEHEWDQAIAHIDKMRKTFEKMEDPKKEAILKMISDLRNKAAAESIAVHVPKNGVITYEDFNKYYIDDVFLGDDFSDALKYTILERDDEIESLGQILCEAKAARRDSDVFLIESDLETLQSITDEFIFSSTSTNEYISYTLLPNRYNELCEKALNYAKRETNRKD